MKTKILTFLAAGCLMAFTACSEDSGSKTLAEKCGDGLTEECLVGTWTLSSIVQKGNKELIASFAGNAGGKLEFREDGIYHYERSSAGSCTTPDEGTWTIEDKNLTLFENKLGDCIDFMKKYTVTPTIEVVGESVTLYLNKVVFQQDESDGMFAGNDTEVFTRTE